MFVARVTADVDTLAQFTEWGGIAWIISIAQVIGGARADARSTRGSSRSRSCSWSSRSCWSSARCRRRLTQAFDLVRTRVGEMLSEVSESVMGAAVVRAYGLERPDRPSA